MADGLRTTFGWDAVGRLTGVTGPCGRARRRPGRGRTGHGVDPGRARTSASAATCGAASSASTTPRPGRSTVLPGSTCERDLAGRITRTRRGATYRYDDAGRLVESLDPTSGRAVVPLRHRRAVGVRELAPRESSPTGGGSSVGSRRSSTPTARETTLTYDSTGRRRASATPTGAVTEYRWDDPETSSASTGRRPTGGSNGIPSPSTPSAARWRSTMHRCSGTTSCTGQPAPGRRRTGTCTSTTGSRVRRAGRALERADRRPLGHRARPTVTEPHVGFRNELAAFGLVWMGARVYDPATREFLSPDPLLAVRGSSRRGRRLLLRLPQPRQPPRSERAPARVGRRSTTRSASSRSRVGSARRGRRSRTTRGARWPWSGSRPSASASASFRVVRRSVSES